MRTISASPVQLRDEPLRFELRLPVRGDRPRLRVLAVRRAVLAVEDEVGREVDEPRAHAVGGERDVPRRAHDVPCEVLVRLAVRGVDDDVRAVLQEDAMHGIVVAEVEVHGAAVRRGRAQLRREHVEAAVDRLPADLGAEIAGAAGDEDAFSEQRVDRRRRDDPLRRCARASRPA